MKKAFKILNSFGFSAGCFLLWQMAPGVRAQQGSDLNAAKNRLSVFSPFSEYPDFVYTELPAPAPTLKPLPTGELNSTPDMQIYEYTQQGFAFEAPKGWAMHGSMHKLPDPYNGWPHMPIGMPQSETWYAEFESPTTVSTPLKSGIITLEITGKTILGNNGFEMTYEKMDVDTPEPEMHSLFTQQLSFGLANNTQKFSAEFKRNGTTIKVVASWNESLSGTEKAQLQQIITSFRYVDVSSVTNTRIAQAVAWAHLPETVRTAHDWPVDGVYGSKNGICWAGTQPKDGGYEVSFGLLALPDDFAPPPDGKAGIWKYLVRKDGTVNELSSPARSPALQAATGAPDSSGAASPLLTKLSATIIPEIHFQSSMTLDNVAIVIGGSSMLFTIAGAKNDKLNVPFKVYPRVGAQGSFLPVLPGYFQIRNVPAMMVLRAICTLANYHYQVEDEVVALRPNDNGAMGAAGDFAVQEFTLPKDLLDKIRPPGWTRPVPNGVSNNMDLEVAVGEIFYHRAGVNVAFGSPGNITYLGDGKISVITAQENIQKIANLFQQYDKGITPPDLHATVSSPAY